MCSLFFFECFRTKNHHNQSKNGLRLQLHAPTLGRRLRHPLPNHDPHSPRRQIQRLRRILQGRQQIGRALPHQERARVHHVLLLPAHHSLNHLHVGVVFEGLGCGNRFSSPSAFFDSLLRPRHVRYRQRHFLVHRQL